MHDFLRLIPLQQLLRLELTHCAIGSKDMQLISQATGLMALNLSHCQNLHGSDLQHLSGPPPLHALLVASQCTLICCSTIHQMYTTLNDHTASRNVLPSLHGGPH